MTPSSPSVSEQGQPSQTEQLQRKLKICQIAATAEGGRWMVEQLRELRDVHGCEVLAVVGGDTGGLIDNLRAHNIAYYVENFNFGSTGSILKLPSTILRQARLFRRERVDVVQSHLFFSMVVTRLAGWLADVPVRLSMYASPFHLQAPLSFWIDRATCWMDSMLIPSCQYTRDLCLEMGVPEEKMTVIYYGPDERDFDPRKFQMARIREEYGWPTDTPLIGQIAFFYAKLPRSRWIPECTHERGGKGFDDTVRAAPFILKEIPNAKILLIGSPWGDPGQAHLDEIKQIVEDLGLAKSVIFTGYRADANEVLMALDVAVQASLVENLGGTIEALLMERPTVVTKVGGMVDAVRDGETGIHVEPSNPRDLARGIVQMFRSGEEGKLMGRAGRKLMLESFTLRTTARNLFEVCSSQSLRNGRGYNPMVSAWRILLAIPVFAYVGGRYLFCELFLPIYLPLWLARFRAIPSRIYYRARHLMALTYYSLRRLARFMLWQCWRALPVSSQLRIKERLGRSDAD